MKEEAILNRLLNNLQSGRYTRSYVEQWLEENAMFEILELLNEALEAPEFEDIT